MRRPKTPVQWYDDPFPESPEATRSSKSLSDPSLAKCRVFEESEAAEYGVGRRGGGDGGGPCVYVTASLTRKKLSSSDITSLEEQFFFFSYSLAMVLLTFRRLNESLKLVYLTSSCLFFLFFFSRASNTDRLSSERRTTWMEKTSKTDISLLIQLTKDLKAEIFYNRLNESMTKKLNKTKLK